MSEKGGEKITGALRSHMERSEDPVLDVIVELTPDPIEANSAPEMQKQFEKAVQPVSAAIDRYGGEVVDSAWLNRTVHARVPAPRLEELSRLQEVATVDVPHQITRD